MSTDAIQHFFLFQISQAQNIFYLIHKVINLKNKLDKLHLNTFSNLYRFCVTQVNTGKSLQELVDVGLH